MNVSAKVALFALMTFCPSRWCDGCLDVLLKSFFQVFNPNVEAGPGRLLSQHRYADGIMPDYRPSVAPTASDDRCNSIRSRYSRRTGPRPDRDDDGPTADYVDGAELGPDGCSGGDARAAPAPPPGYVTGERPLTELIVSLLETFQLTSRAALKRSAKTDAAGAANGSADRDG